MVQIEANRRIEHLIMTKIIIDFDIDNTDNDGLVPTSCFLCSIIIFSTKNWKKLRFQYFLQAITVLQEKAKKKAIFVLKIRSRSENRSISYRRITHQANSFFSVIDLAKKQILRETKKNFYGNNVIQRTTKTNKK